mmetsp:Transcript_3887/g.9730  ORF Transcript_3887/g.9730 Transcript_3887/m.9730 type:complete len:258 (-) Transcript_3887:799-1572(-)
MTYQGNELPDHVGPEDRAAQHYGCGHHDLQVTSGRNVPQPNASHRIDGEIETRAVLVQHVVSLKSVALVPQLTGRRVVRPVLDLPAPTRLGLGADAVGRPARLVRAYAGQRRRIVEISIQVRHGRVDVFSCQSGMVLGHATPHDRIRVHRLLEPVHPVVVRLDVGVGDHAPEARVPVRVHDQHHKKPHHADFRICKHEDRRRLPPLQDSRGSYDSEQLQQSQQSEYFDVVFERSRGAAFRGHVHGRIPVAAVVPLVE